MQTVDQSRTQNDLENDQLRKSQYGKRFQSLDYDANNYNSRSFEVIPQPVESQSTQLRSFDKVGSTHADSYNDHTETIKTQVNLQSKYARQFSEEQRVNQMKQKLNSAYPSNITFQDKEISSILNNDSMNTISICKDRNDAVYHENGSTVNIKANQHQINESQRIIDQIRQKRQSEAKTMFKQIDEDTYPRFQYNDQRESKIQHQHTQSHCEQPFQNLNFNDSKILKTFDIDSDDQYVHPLSHGEKETVNKEQISKMTGYSLSRKLESIDHGMKARNSKSHRPVFQAAKDDTMLSVPIIESLNDKLEMYKSKYMYMFEKCNRLKRKIKQQSNQKESLKNKVTQLQSHCNYLEQ